MTIIYLQFWIGRSLTKAVGVEHFQFLGLTLDLPHQILFTRNLQLFELSWCLFFQCRQIVAMGNMGNVIPIQGVAGLQENPVLVCDEQVPGNQRIIKTLIHPIKFQ